MALKMGGQGLTVLTMIGIAAFGLTRLVAADPPPQPHPRPPEPPAPAYVAERDGLASALHGMDAYVSEESYATQLDMVHVVYDTDSRTELSGIAVKTVEMCAKTSQRVVSPYDALNVLRLAGPAAKTSSPSQVLALWVATGCQL